MSVGSTPLPRIPPGFPWRPRRKTESPAGWRDPAEELPRPDERSDARRGRRVTILLGVTDVSGCAQAHAVETGQREEHPGSWLAAVAAVRVRVGAAAVVGERSPEPLVGPGEPPQNLGRRDLPLRDARLVGDDEARVEARALAGERRAHVGHEHGVARGVDDRPIVLGEGESAAPVQEEGTLRGGHRATVSRSRSPSPEFRRDFTVSTHDPVLEETAPGDASLPTRPPVRSRRRGLSGRGTFAPKPGRALTNRRILLSHSAHPVESDFTARVELTGLPAGQQIFYRILFEDLASPKVLSEPATGRFRTPSQGRRTVSFAFSGDEAGQGWGINTAWGGMKMYETMRR